MRIKNKSAVTTINETDGPTSIFIAEKPKNQSLKVRIKKCIYNIKRKKAEKTITANPHSLTETVQYAKDKYELIETAPTDREYIEQQKCLKSSLILQHKPEVLGNMQTIPKPDYSDEESVKKYFEKIVAQREMIENMPDNILPMDFHLYKMQIGNALLEMATDYTWNIFSISYYGNKKEIKKFEKISKELYMYYGVSEDDIKNKTKRYSSLVTTLSS